MKLLATQKELADFAQSKSPRFKGAPYYIGRAFPSAHRWEIWKGTHIGDEVILDPAASLAIWDHSPDGFSWGYGGSAPAQLALAILLDATGDADFAVEWHQDFKWKYIAKLNSFVGWIMTVAFVEEWAATPERVQ